jgi:hypothetical protein
VCVDYAEHLAHSLRRWHAGMERLTVVTSSADKATQELCRRHNVETFVTDIFYANGASFNKGAALSEAFSALKLREATDDWLLAFDSDIVPPADWRNRLERTNLQPGTLYGAWRYQGHLSANGTLIDKPGELLLIGETGIRNKREDHPWGYVVGFFMLFHARDPLLPAADPIFDMCWSHAGNYDTVFCDRWPVCRKIVLQMDTLHLGEVCRNWAGCANVDKLRCLFADKDKNRWRREKLANPPCCGSCDE